MLLYVVTISQLSKLSQLQLLTQLWVVRGSHIYNFLVVEPDNMDNFESDNHKVVPIDYLIDNCS